MNRWLIRLIALVAGIALVGAYVAYQQRQQATRDRQRADVVASVRDRLAEYKTAQGRFPAGNGDLAAQTGGLTQVANLPTLVRPDDHLYYSVTPNGSFFVACIPSEGPSTTFVNAEGSFRTSRQFCTADMTPETSRFVTANKMTDEAATAFYTARPTVLSKDETQQKCSGSVHGEGITAGCYTGQIYVMNYDQPEIAPEEDVTAAHEMLHAAYERLSKRERERVDQLTADAYQRVKDPKLEKYMAGYTEADRANELHSVLGTEYPNLSPELEKYYQRWFVERSTVANKHLQYRQLLDGLEAEINRMRAQLNALGDRADRLKAAGYIGGYNALVPQYNSLVGQINARIDRYNSLTAHTRSNDIQAPVGTKGS